MQLFDLFLRNTSGVLTRSITQTLAATSSVIIAASSAALVFLLMVTTPWFLSKRGRGFANALDDTPVDGFVTNQGESAPVSASRAETFPPVYTTRLFLGNLR